MIVWRIRGKIITTVLCGVLCKSKTVLHNNNYNDNNEHICIVQNKNPQMR